MCIVALTSVDRGADDVPVERDALGGRRRGRHLAAGEDSRARRMPTVAAAAIAGVAASDAGEDRPAEDRDIGAGLDQAGAAEHFVLAADAAAGSHI